MFKSVREMSEDSINNTGCHYSSGLRLLSVVCPSGWCIVELSRMTGVYEARPYDLTMPREDQVHHSVLQSACKRASERGLSSRNAASPNSLRRTDTLLTHTHTLATPRRPVRALFLLLRGAPSILMQQCKTPSLPSPKYSWIFVWISMSPEEWPFTVQ